MKKYSYIFGAYFWLIILFVLLIINNLHLFNFQNIKPPSQNSINYASNVISYTGIIGDVSAAIGITEFPHCYKMCSVSLLNGYIILGFNAPIMNKEGNDFIVYEVDDLYTNNSFNSFNSLKIFRPNNYMVLASNDLLSWKLVGYGFGITAFDLARADMPSAKYIKLSGVGATQNMSSFSADAPNIDAVEAINSSE